MNYCNLPRWIYLSCIYVCVGELKNTSPQRHQKRCVLRDSSGLWIVWRSSYTMTICYDMLIYWYIYIYVYIHTHIYIYYILYNVYSCLFPKKEPDMGDVCRQQLPHCGCSQSLSSDTWWETFANFKEFYNPLELLEF